MTYDTTNKGESSNTYPPPSILPATTAVMTLPFPFPMPGQQTFGTSAPFVSLSSLGATTTTLQTDKTFNYKLCLRLYKPCWHNSQSRSFSGGLSSSSTIPDAKFPVFIISFKHGFQG